jgi:hypothetical protein
MSQQNSGTPIAFLQAIENKFNVKLQFDLACTTQDCIVQQSDQSPVGYYNDLGIDSLQQNWRNLHVNCCWLNPPFRHIRPWVKKCNQLLGFDDTDPDILLSGPRVFALVPASVCSSWYADYVQGNCGVYFLRPRLVFIDPRTGEPFVNQITGRPQTAINDCMLLDFGGPLVTECWKWK